MSECIFIKIGGSFITDKTTPNSLNATRIRTVASGISAALKQKEFDIVLGHGAGAYGHISAREFNAQAGVHPEFGWEGFHRIRQDMSAMNASFVQLCREEGLSPITVQPSAVITASAGTIHTIHTNVIEKLLKFNQIPLIHGDIVVDNVQGFTIASTEEIVTRLAPRLHFHRVIMISDVPGVLNTEGNVIPEINHRNMAQVIKQLKGSKGIDVTGGMKSKVAQLYDLCRRGYCDKAIITTCATDDPSELTSMLISDLHSGTSISQ